MPHHDIVREPPSLMEIDARPPSVPTAITSIIGGGIGSVPAAPLEQTATSVTQMDGRTRRVVHPRASRRPCHAPAPRGTTGTPVRTLQNCIAARPASFRSGTMAVTDHRNIGSSILYDGSL